MKQPDILIIMSDQHHPRFMGCAGEAVVRTPTLDALAARGTRFEHAYCNSPLCGPSRAAYATARMPSRLNCLDNHRQVDSDILTFAHQFAAAGYETVLSGRMHFNGPDQRHGFHKRLVGDVTDVCRPEGAALRDVLGPDLMKTTGPSANAIRQSGPGRSGYQVYDETVARAAADWLTSRDDERPYLLHVGFILPHAPFVAPPDDFNHFNALVSENDLPEADDNLHPEMIRLQKRSGLVGGEDVSRADQRRARVAYYGMCAHLDRQVKTVLDAADLDNTIVVYTSDHGEQLGEHGMWWKHTFYEGSIGVPMVFAGPGVPQGETRTQNVSLLDVGPTLLDMVDAPALPEVDGASFACLFDGDGSAWHDTVYAENLWPPGADCLHRMVKRGPWKLNHYHGFEPQLFNLDDDPGEMHDRAGDAVTDELMELATCDWDHDAIMAAHRKHLEAQKVIREARFNGDMAEPDAPWHDGAIENWFDASR